MTPRERLSVGLLILLILITGGYYYLYGVEQPYLAANVGATSIIVSSPNGSETWQRGSLHSIGWDATVPVPDTLPTITIDLVSAAEDRQYTITHGPLDRTYEWVVGEFPAMTSFFDIPDGQYTIQICSSERSVCDESDQLFVLATPQLLTIQWGQIGDIAQPADYNGDGTTDLATWSAARNMLTVRNIGTFSEIDPAEKQLAVPDFNGDGMTETATWNNASLSWNVLGKVLSFQQYLDSGTYLPVSGDYTGDGKTDLALWQALAQDTGLPTWYIYTGPL